MNQNYNFVFRPPTASESGKWVEESIVTPDGGTAVTIIGPPTDPLTPGVGADVKDQVIFAGDAHANGLITAAVISGNSRLTAGEPEHDFLTATVDNFGLSTNNADEISARAIYANSAMMAFGLNSDSFIGMLTSAPLDGTAINSGDDGVALIGVGLNYGFDGSGNWDPVRTASAANQSAATKTAPMQVATPGTWSITHAPAANTQATITRAAGAAGVRHVCTAITATLVAPIAVTSGAVQLNLRDGATGAGTILKSFTLQVGGAASTITDRAIIQLSGLQVVGSAATAMTLEFSAAGGASTLESVSLEGYDIN